MGFKISRNTSLKCGKIVYVDMDNVLVDFQSGLDRVPEAVKAEYADDGTGKPHYDEIPGIFSLMDPMPGAIEAMQELNKFFDLYILSTAPWLNPSAWCDKLEWIQRQGKRFHLLQTTHHLSPQRPQPRRLPDRRSREERSQGV